MTSPILLHLEHERSRIAAEVSSLSTQLTAKRDELAEADRAIRAILGRGNRHGILPGSKTALMLTAADTLPAPFSPRHLAAAAGISVSAASAYANRLEERGLFIRVDRGQYRLPYEGAAK